MNADLPRQIALLEAQNRQLKRLSALGMACTLLLAVLTLAGWRSAAQQVFQAQRFEVVDPSGKVVGGFGSTVTGGAKMTIHNEKGVTLLSMGDAPGGECSFSIFDSAGAKRIFAGATVENPRNYVVSVDSGRPGSNPGARSIQMGRFGDDEAGIRIFGSSDKAARLKIGLKGNEDSEIYLTQTGTGASIWRTRENHSEISFTNAIAEGRDTRLGPSLFINRPAGRLMQIDSATSYWPKSP